MKSVIDRKKSTITVVAASRRYALPAAAKLEELLAPELEPGETLPDMELVQKLFGRALDRRWHQLSKADEDALAGQQGHRELDAEHGAALRTLYREVVDLRTVLRGIFGAAGGRFLCLKGETSRDPVVLLRQADRAVTRLLHLTKSLPPSTFDWNQMRERWAAPVAAAVEALQSLDDRARLAVKEVEGALLLRQRTLDDFNVVLVQVAGWLESTYRAAGLDVQANSVRPSRQRPGRLLEEVRRQAARKKAKRVKKVSDEARESVADPQVRKPEPPSEAPGTRVLPFPVAVAPPGREQAGSASEGRMNVAEDSPASGQGLLRQWATFLGLGGGSQPRKGR